MKKNVGIAEVVKEYDQDPSTDDHQWSAIDVEAYRRFKKPVTLAEIKAEEKLSSMVLVKNSRLSVKPEIKQQFDMVVAMREF